MLPLHASNLVSTFSRCKDLNIPLLSNQSAVLMAANIFPQVISQVAEMESHRSAKDINVHCVTLSSPSPVLSFVQSVPSTSRVSLITVDDSRCGYSKYAYQDMHISARLMEEFLELAKDNTNKDLETCGVLGASFKDGIFYVTTLIIPKQEATSSSCTALNEEEMYAIQDEHSLCPVGWIHTHPSQTCFMSSIDMHTQYSYQVKVATQELQMQTRSGLEEIPFKCSKKQEEFASEEDARDSCVRDCSGGCRVGLQIEERIAGRRPIRDEEDIRDPHGVKWIPPVGTQTGYWDKPPIFDEYPDDVIKKKFVDPFWEGLANFDKRILLFTLFLDALQYRDIGDKTIPLHLDTTLGYKKFRARIEGLTI
ncbi:hypothetical protein GIB67_003291, partial [Kingdonia uniflora]